jgi:hypothetical protein
MSNKEDRERIQMKKLMGVFGANGSLDQLSSAQLIEFRAKLINYLGLNKWTLPFRFYSDTSGGIYLYATKECCAQLRELRGISVINTTDYVRDDVLKTITIKITGVNKNGRTSIATGSVCYENSLPADYHNHIMWAETKAMRRLTLDLSGLGVLADIEVRDMQGVAALNVIEEEKEEGDVDVIPLNSNQEKVANALSSIVINKK